MLIRINKVRVKLSIEISIFVIQEFAIQVGRVHLFNVYLYYITLSETASRFIFLHLVDRLNILDHLDQSVHLNLVRLDQGCRLCLPQNH